MIVKSVGIFQSADSWSGVTLATAKGFLNIVIKLLENGADPNSLTKVNLKLVNIFYCSNFTLMLFKY